MYNAVKRALECWNLITSGEFQLLSPSAQMETIRALICAMRDLEKESK